MQPIGINEVLSINKDGILSCREAALSEDAVLVEGQYVNCQRNGCWQIGVISRIMDKKICAQFDTDYFAEFEWVQRNEFPQRLRLAFKGEEDIHRYIIALRVTREKDGEKVSAKSQEFSFENSVDIVFPINSVNSMMFNNTEQYTVDLLMKPGNVTICLDPKS